MSRLTQFLHNLADKPSSAISLHDEFMGLLRGNSKPPAPPAKPAPSAPTKQWFDENDRPFWLVRAMGYIGVHEDLNPGKDNPVILNWAKAAGPGSMTAKEYDHDSVPWCMLYAMAVLRECGLKALDSLWALDTLKLGIPLAGPAVGCLAAMVRDGGGHVTFVVGRDKNGNLMCCGGNQSDAVNIKPFDPDRVKGYRWPSEPPLPKDVGFDSLPLVKSDGKLSTNEA